MNWKTLAALPIIAFLIWVVISAIEFGNAVGRTWNEGTTTTIVNGLVMICFSGVLLFAIIVAALLGVALATRILSTPLPKGSHMQDRGYGGHRPSLMDRWRGRAGPGWDEPYIDAESRVIGIEPPLANMRPMLGPGQGVAPMLTGPMASGAFDGMEDGHDGRYRG